MKPYGVWGTSYNPVLTVATTALSRVAEALEHSGGVEPVDTHLIARLGEAIAGLDKIDPEHVEPIPNSIREACLYTLSAARKYNEYTARSN